MYFGATEKQANDLLNAGTTDNKWQASTTELKTGFNWKHAPGETVHHPNYTMEPVRVAGSLAENSLNPNAVTTPSKTIHVAKMLPKEFHYNPWNKFDFSSEHMNLNPAVAAVNK